MAIRRIITGAALSIGIALSVAGCAQMKAISTGISLSTASIANPVDKTKEAEIELAATSAFTVLNTYRRSCLAGTADNNCKDNIRQIQPYVRQLKPLMAQLRDFVDHNDQVNAVVAYNQVAALLSGFQQTATTAGVK